jgi:hypothetical protein
MVALIKQLTSTELVQVVKIYPRADQVLAAMFTSRTSPLDD